MRVLVEEITDAIELVGGELIYTENPTNIPRSMQNMNLGMLQDVDKLVSVNVLDLIYIVPRYQLAAYVFNGELVREIPEELLIENWKGFDRSLSDLSSSLNQNSIKIQTQEFPILSSDTTLTALAKHLLTKPIYVNKNDAVNVNKIISSINKSIGSNDVTYKQVMKLIMLLNLRLDLLVNDPSQKSDIIRVKCENGAVKLMLSK